MLEEDKTGLQKVREARGSWKDSTERAIYVYRREREREERREDEAFGSALDFTLK